MLARGPLAEDRLTLGFLLQSVKPSIFNGHLVPQGSLLMFNENQELHADLAAGASWLAVQPERVTLERIGIDAPTTPRSNPSLDG